ncbi:MAG: hypothetical protein KDA93_19035 [Planctomycetaceae bacterium]|nr:hypothetical protein [Planctomycetaceae bacterium]
MRPTIICLAIQSVSLLSVVADDDTRTRTAWQQSADSRLTIQGLMDQVEAGREEIVSAEIHYRWHISTYRNSSNTPERVRTLLDEYDVMSDPDSLDALVKELVPEPQLNGPLWETRDFAMLGEKRSARTSRGSTQLVDGDHEMTYHQFNEQLMVSGRGGSSVHKTHIEDFRAFPPSGTGAQNYRLVSQGDGFTTLALIWDPDVESEDADFDQYTFDDATGVVTHELTHFRGQLKSEVWQRGLTEYSGGVTLPMLRLKTLYRDGVLRSLTIWKIESASLNVPVDEGRFIMPVPKDTVLVDARLPAQVVQKVQKPVGDVRSILAPISVAGAHDADPGGVNWRLLLILNGLVFIILAGWFWRRGSIKASE